MYLGVGVVKLSQARKWLIDVPAAPMNGRSDTAATSKRDVQRAEYIVATACRWLEGVPILPSEYGPTRARM